MESKKKEYTMGKWPESWREAEAQNLTFIVTEDCNLRCKYCYVTHKSSNAKMDFQTAKKFIDYIFSIKRPDQHAVILDFIGGEPLLEVDLIDKICDYFKYKAFQLKDEWYWNYRISICTNGVNYDNEKVQKFIDKNYKKISVTITIDGTKEKHDLQRVFPNGEGSYNTVVKNIPLWLEKFEGSTKVTFASDDLPMLKDSIIHLWNMGITDIAANVVFENVWKENDDRVFEKQLRELADYVIDNELYDKYRCTLFTDSIGFPETEESLQQTSCGAGVMLALGVDGKIYPCQRYYSHSLNNRAGYVLGDVENGINMNKLRVFGTLARKYQCDDECKTCDVASGCMYCQAFSYDDADTATNFQRAKYICKMHKARVRANNYYFAKLKNEKGIKADRRDFAKYLYFILQDDFISFCSYKNRGANNKNVMNKEKLFKGLAFAYENFMQPVFLHSKEEIYHFYEEFFEYDILHIVPIEFFDNNKFLNNEEYLVVIDRNGLEKLSEIDCKNIIFNLDAEEVSYLSKSINKAFEYVDRINLNISGIKNRLNLENYEEELTNCKEEIVKRYKRTHVLKELNVLTDVLYLKTHDRCLAGEKAFTFAPNGEIYVCPAFYSEKMESIGNLDIYTNTNEHLYKIENFPICQMCDAYHCEKCIYTNVTETNEVNVSPDFQCIKAHIERKVSLLLSNELKGMMDFPNDLHQIEYMDPYVKLRKNVELLGMYHR